MKYNYEDPEVEETDRSAKFLIPFLPNKLGLTPFWQIHDSSLRVLADSMMNSISFDRIIREQSDVGELLD